MCEEDSIAFQNGHFTPPASPSEGPGTLAPLCPPLWRPCLDRLQSRKKNALAYITILCIPAEGVFLYDSYSNSY